MAKAGQMTVEEQIALCREFDALKADFRGRVDGLAHIVADDFPGDDAHPGQVTRYHVAALRDLVQSLAALEWGYERLS